MRHLISSFFTLITFASIGQLPINVLGTTDGGAAYEICYHDDFLYVGAANTLEVFSLDSLTHTPQALLYKKRLLSNIDQLIIRDGHLYVCANHDGLYKFNLSDPAQPLEVFHYHPEDLTKSIYDIAFYGDTLIIAAKTVVQFLYNDGNTIKYLATLASYGEDARIRGLDSKGSLLAYTVGFTQASIDDGIYLYDLQSKTHLDYYSQTISDPLEVYFGQENDLLHVMGGTINSTLFNGYYYVLNYSDQNNLQLIFQDTILGFAPLGSISAPMSAKLIHDTIYIATQGGGPKVTTPTYSGQVYVYDATNPQSIQFVEDLYGGLYHFDIDIDPISQTMYVASEWYGVLTVDITNLEQELDLGLTLTGGWCHGSAMANNKLVEANEGYGIRLFDLSDVADPRLIAEDVAVGFCRAISFSEFGDYVYGWNLTGDGLRIFDGNTLDPISSVEVPLLLKTDFKASQQYNGTLAVILEQFIGPDQIIIADVHLPESPKITFNRNKSNLEDILFGSNGDLFVCARDSIIVFNPQSMEIITTVTPPLGLLQPFKAFTLCNDTLYVYYGGLGEGIARYSFDSMSNDLEFIDATPYDMKAELNGRVFLVGNDSIIFIASSIDSLKLLKKYPPFNVIGIYNHGGDFIYNNIWGLQDLYFQDDLLVLNEYMGQTTILGSTQHSGIDGTITVNQELLIYPNPTDSQINIEISKVRPRVIELFNMRGQQLYVSENGAQNISIDVSSFVPGTYLVRVTTDHSEKIYGKFVVMQ